MTKTDAILFAVFLISQRLPQKITTQEVSETKHQYESYGELHKQQRIKLISTSAIHDYWILHGKPRIYEREATNNPRRRRHWHQIECDKTIMSTETSRLAMRKVLNQRFTGIH